MATTEVQQYLKAISAVRSAPPLDLPHLEKFMDDFFHCSVDHHGDASLDAPTTIDTDYMNITLEAVEFFLEFSIIMFAKGFGANSIHQPEIMSLLSTRKPEEKERLLSTALPTSMWSNKQRLRIALLRFQLYCEFFHHPEVGEAGDALDSDWEERLPEQEAFWLRYEWWEVEEVKCVYQILLFSLENMSTQSNVTDHGTAKERGLTQLRHFVDDSVVPPTAFGHNYLRQFLARPFHGFNQIDPEDYGYVSAARPEYKRYYLAAGVEPEGTYKTTFRETDQPSLDLQGSAKKSRRWRPSRYPGVELEYFSNQRLVPIECQGIHRDAAQIRKFLRLVGWVFWGSDKIHDWLELGKTFERFRLEAGDYDEDWAAPRGLYGRRPFRWSQQEFECCDDNE